MKNPFKSVGLAEYLGVFLLLFPGFLSMYIFYLIDWNWLFWLLPFIFAFGGWTGMVVGMAINKKAGHLNTIVTLLSLRLKKTKPQQVMNPLQMCMALLAQVAASITVAGILAVCFSFEARYVKQPDNYEGWLWRRSFDRARELAFGAPGFEGMSTFSAMAVEFFFTLGILITVYTAWKLRLKPASGAALVTLAIFAGMLAGRELTGGGMNPAAVFGPGLWSWEIASWRWDLVYLVTPLLTLGIFLVVLFMLNL